MTFWYLGGLQREDQAMLDQVADAIRAGLTHGLLDPTDNPVCLACHTPIGDAMRWAVVWDGEKWCAVPYVMTMPLGPYHGSPCISQGLTAKVPTAKEKKYQDAQRARRSQAIGQAGAAVVEAMVVPGEPLEDIATRLIRSADPHTITGRRGEHFTYSFDYADVPEIVAAAEVLLRIYEEQKDNHEKPWVHTGSDQSRD